jgi:hypothetical protein
MPRALRRFLIGGGILLVGLGAAYAYFLRYPAPEPPRLSSAVRHDSLQVGERTRGYTFYVPATPAPAPPLVLALRRAAGGGRPSCEVLDDSALEGLRSPASESSPGFLAMAVSMPLLRSLAAIFCEDYRNHTGR